MPRESSILERTRRHYRDAAADGFHVMKTSGNGEPDLVGVIDGVAVVVECKQPGKRPEPLQTVRLNQWRSGGAVAIWTDGTAYFETHEDSMTTRLGDFSAYTLSEEVRGRQRR